MLYQAGLVLEGGGMKGAYTAGVLDFFLDKGIDFAKCYGVSAGATTLCSYLSKQRGRGFATMADYVDDPAYAGVKSLLKTGDIFNVEMCYHRIPDELNPFDHDTFEKNPSQGYAVVTNIVTGAAEYVPLRNMRKDIEYVRASASLPLISRNVEIGGKVYLDGAMADSIPLLHSMVDGNKKNVVVLTKEVGFRRKPSSQLGLIRMKYRKYPKVYELMKNRHIHYNQELDLIEQQVKNGNCFVIRPQHKSQVGRLEKDREKLQALYQVGYEEAEAQYGALMRFLNA